jgi:hypothetical protein
MSPERARKPSSEKFASHLTKTGELLGLDRRRLKWLKYIYRFDDIESIASVLEHDRLYSRASCVALGLPHRDAAAQEVVNNNPDAHEFARLYFRPRTPTQYRNEGIRPKWKIWKDAHCPVPVFLLFDSVSMLTRPEAMFSSRSMAKGASGKTAVGSDFAFFRKLPFDLIYHDGSMRPDEDHKLITECRQAEVLFEDGVDLEDLKEIVCRTEPERWTLLSILQSSARSRWKERIRLELPGERIFERSGTFVNDIRLDGAELRIDLEPMVGPFSIKMQVLDASTKSALVTVNRDIDQARTRHRVKLPAALPKVAVRMRIEGALAFSGILRQPNLYS